MSHTRRTLMLGALGAAIAGGLIFVTFRPEPVPVDLHTVTRGAFRETVDVDGITRVTEVYEISAPIAGTAQRAPVRVGDPVTAGVTVVARVEPSSPGLLDARSRLQAEAAVREAEATLHVAETGLARAEETAIYAQQQYDRARQLVDRGVASLSRLEDAYQQLAVARAAQDAEAARIEQAASALERARAALVESVPATDRSECCVPILAPADGVVLEIDQISARPVAAGARLLSIGDPTRIEIVADLLSSDAVRLPQGARASVERWGGAPLDARLVRVDPTGRTKVSALGIEEQRVDAIFELVAEQSDGPRLGHGFAAFLRIVMYEEDDALLVPLSAVFRRGDGWAVFRAAGDRLERIPVEIGRRNSRFAVVRSGLEPGDRVVEHPREDLTDGSLYEERAAF